MCVACAVFTTCATSVGFDAGVSLDKFEGEDHVSEC